MMTIIACVVYIVVITIDFIINNKKRNKTKKWLEDIEKNNEKQK